MNATTSVSSILNDLIETCRDGQEGFRAAAEDVQNPDYKSLFSTLSIQRQEFVIELQGQVRERGKEAEGAGSVAGALHRGWIHLKSSATLGDEHAILEECERGEDFALKSYREALESADLPPHVRAVIERQFMAVKEAHDRVRGLRDRTK